MKTDVYYVSEQDALEWNQAAQAADKRNRQDLFVARC
jgi:hypothetical protein